MCPNCGGPWSWHEAVSTPEYPQECGKCRCHVGGGFCRFPALSEKSSVNHPRWSRASTSMDDSMGLNG